MWISKKEYNKLLSSIELLSSRTEAINDRITMSTLKLNNEIVLDVKNDSSNPMPKYSTSGSAGMDLRADLDAPVVIAPLSRELIPTGLHIQLPEGFEAQIRPRSGLALRDGITVLNTPGTIDSDFLGNISVILINLGTEPFIVNHGDRIAQMVVASYTKITINPKSVLKETERGEGGFGHTGVK